MNHRRLLAGFSVLLIGAFALFGMLIDGFFRSYAGIVIKREMVDEAGSPPHPRLTVATAAGEVGVSVPKPVYRRARVGERIEKRPYRWAVTVGGDRLLPCGATLLLGFQEALISASAALIHARYGRR